MITAILLLALMQPQDPGLAAASARDTTTVPERTEKLTPAEVKALADANQAVADAQAKLIQAKAALQGHDGGHRAGASCEYGLWLLRRKHGRDYDKVEFKGDTIVIHHIHEAPASLTKKTTQ